LLVNGQGKRVEVADNAIARDGSDTRMDARVRTPGSCVVCHGPNNGFNPPRNAFKELLDAGVDVKFRDKRQAARVRSFFLSWERKARTFTAGYEALVEDTTKNAEGRAWKADRLALAFQEFRDWYDEPVTPAQAAAECGMTVRELKAVGAKSVKARLN